MIKIQLNIGDDNNQNQIDVDVSDMIVFSNGYISIDSTYTGMKKIVNEFNDVDGAYAKYCHLISDNNIYQVNYNGEQLYNAETLVLSGSTSLSKFSFRLIFIDYYIDWVKVPQMFSQVPKFFYATSKIDTLITPFFYTDESSIETGHILEIDEYKFIVVNTETLSTYYKIWLRPYTEGQNISISKEKYLVRDYDIPSIDSSFYDMAKFLFHDENITLDSIPYVDSSSDVDDTSLRNFRNTYEQFNLDISNYPFYIDIDSTLDLTADMIISDFTLNSNINIGDSVIYATTSKITDIKIGDSILIKNDINTEIFNITDVNSSYNSYTVSRPYTQYTFLKSDSSIVVYLCKKIYFQPLLLNYGNNSVNYPILMNMLLKYLNI